MATDNEIIDELRTILLPNQSVEHLIQQSKLELEWRLQESSVSMIPSGAIRPFKLPSLKSGSFLLAIDFGGSTLKVGIISLDELKAEHVRTYPYVSNTVNQNFFKLLIEWICGEVHSYIKNLGDEGDLVFYVGTTFSFPLNSMNEITTMGKGFMMTEEVKGVSLLEILKQNFHLVLLNNEQYKFKVQVHGVINDSVAVYLTNKAKNGNSDLSLILGTGINSCFSLPTSRLPAFKKPPCQDAVLINAEIGFIGEKFIQLTKFDPHKLDCEPFMPLEFVTSGKWMPLTLKKILQHYQRLPNQPLNFTGELICQILVGQTLEISITDLTFIQQITKILIKRAAFYLTCVLLSVVQFMGCNQQTLHVGYVGSFLHHCDFYKEQIKQYTYGTLVLHFLKDSNLIGATIDTCQNLLSTDDQIPE